MRKGGGRDYQRREGLSEVVGGTIRGGGGTIRAGRDYQRWEGLSEVDSNIRPVFSAEMRSSNSPFSPGSSSVLFPRRDAFLSTARFSLSAFIYNMQDEGHKSHIITS